LKKKKIKIQGHKVLIASVGFQGVASELVRIAKSLVAEMNRSKWISIIKSFNNVNQSTVRAVQTKPQGRKTNGGRVGTVYFFDATDFAAKGIHEAIQKEYPNNVVEMNRLKTETRDGEVVPHWEIYVVMDGKNASSRGVVAQSIHEAILASNGSDKEMAEVLLKDLERLQAYLVKSVAELKKVRDGGDSSLSATSNVVAWLKDGSHHSKATEHFFG